MVNSFSLVGEISFVYVITGILLALRLMLSEIRIRDSRAL